MYIFLNIKCFAFNIFAVKLLIYILFLLLPVQVLQRIKVPTFAICDTNQNYVCHGSISSVDIYIVNYTYFLSNNFSWCKFVLCISNIYF